MIKISILYPNLKNSWFDMDYYINKHLPMFIDQLTGSSGFRGISVEKGLEIDNLGSIPVYVASCHFLFDSLDNFKKAFNLNDDKIREDIPNYTDIKPLIHVSEKIKIQPAL